MEIDNDYLERQERQQKYLRDQYNELKNQERQYADLDDFTIQILQSTEDYAIKKSQTLEQYIPTLEAYVTLYSTTSMKKHVTCPKGAWYSHRSPEGCFICKMQNLNYYLLNLLKTISKNNEKLTPSS